MTVSELREELEFLSFKGYGECEVKLLFLDIVPQEKVGIYVIDDIFVLSKRLSDGSECIFIDGTPEIGGDHDKI